MDTTETKTYIIKIQSDLDKYTKEAIAAKKALEDAKYAVDNLTKGQFHSREEIEKVNAAYRDAKKEYADKTKLVDLSTKALKAEQGSYEQLLRVHKLMETALKLEAGTMKRSADGTFVMTEKYIQLSKEVQNAKKGLDEFGKGINDNRLNVGNYGQAIEGAFKDAGSKIMSMVGPMAVVGAAIGVATKLWEGMKEAMMSTTFVIDTMNKSVAVSKQLFYDLAINGKTSLETLIQASKVQGELNSLRIRDSVEALQMSKLNREQQAIREIAIDRTKTDEERLAAFIKVKEMESQKTKIQVDNLKDELKAKEDLFRIQPANEKLMLNIINLRTQINDAYAAEDTAMRRVMGQLTGFEQEKIELRKKGYDAWMAEIDAQNKADEDTAAKRVADAAKVKADAEKAMADSKKNLTKEIEDYKKFISDKQKEDAKDKEKKKADLLQHQEWERNQFLSNQENLIAMKEANNEWLYSIERQRLDIQYRDEIANAVKTGADRNIIEAKYAALREQINRAEAEAKLGLYADFAGNLATIFGKNTAIGKAAAIAETTINTYRSATAAYAALAGVPVVGPVLGIAAAAAAVAAGIANVKKILAVKVPGGGGEGQSAPTAISGSQPAQRAFAQSAGSSILTQVQLSQPQLNAIPQQNMLTAADIANALKGMPAPVVTVEDINVKVKSMNKVSVRANI